MWFYHRVVHPSDADNGNLSVDTDQTALVYTFDFKYRNFCKKKLE